MNACVGNVLQYTTERRSCLRSPEEDGNDDNAMKGRLTIEVVSAEVGKGLIESLLDVIDASCPDLGSELHVMKVRRE